MYKQREIGNYNVTINEGQLDHESNRWFYILQVDKSEGEKWIESKCFYIKGHKDGKQKEKFLHISMISMWLNRLTFRELERIFLMFPNNYKFKICEPTLVSA